MRRRLCITFAAILASCGAAHAEPVLLGAFERVNGSGSTGITDPRAQLGIHLYADGPSPVPIQLDSILYSADYLADGANGTFDFWAVTSGAFAEIAQLATNGVDDSLALFTIWPELGQGGIRSDSESFYFQRDVPGGEEPDFVGYELDRIRLIIRDVSIDPFSALGQDGYVATFDYTYEFYGTPVPEPATIALLMSAWMMHSPRRPV